MLPRALLLPPSSRGMPPKRNVPATPSGKAGTQPSPQRPKLSSPPSPSPTAPPPQASGDGAWSWGCAASALAVLGTITAGLLVRPNASTAPEALRRCAAAAASLAAALGGLPQPQMGPLGPAVALLGGGACACAASSARPSRSAAEDGARRRAARRRWKKGRAFASSIQGFSGKIMTAGEIELYENAGSPVDLKAYEGMMQSKLIAAPEAGRWSQVRNVVLKHGPDGLRGVGVGTGGAKKSRRISDLGALSKKMTSLVKHSALVFDCADKHTTVYRLQYDPNTSSVRATTVGNSAGVSDLLERNAGHWFLTFAKKACAAEQEQPQGAPEVTMIGTHAWHEAGDSDGAGAADPATPRSEQAKASAKGQRAQELVSSLSRCGLLCKRLGSSEQALFEALAVRESACRLGMSPHPTHFLGSGPTWVHCVALTSADAPIVLCNDSSLGWMAGVGRLQHADEPLQELEDWMRDTVIVELDHIESRRVAPLAKLDGSIVVSGAGYDAGVLASLASGPSELRPVRASSALQAMEEALASMKRQMVDSLLDFKTAPTMSSTFAEGHRLASALCNLSLHIEILQRLVDPRCTLYFKKVWAGVKPVLSVAKRRGKRRASPTRTPSPLGERTSSFSEIRQESDEYKPTWVIGWYMHLLKVRFGVGFLDVEALMGHLDGLYENAMALASMYDAEHADGGKPAGSAAENESVALTLVTMRDVVELMRSKAQGLEPRATDVLTTLTDSVGGRMDGLAYKFKSEESLFRKLIQRLDRQLKENEHIPSFTPSMKVITHEVDDCLRYTIVIPTAQYTAGVSHILDRLLGKSERPSDAAAVASKINAYNFWSAEKGVSTYMGINAFVTLAPAHSAGEKDGYTFE